jgi:hypothetical protein
MISAPVPKSAKKKRRPMVAGIVHHLRSDGRIGGFPSGIMTVSGEGTVSGIGVARAA